MVNGRKLKYTYIDNTNHNNHDTKELIIIYPLFFYLFSLHVVGVVRIVSVQYADFWDEMSANKDHQGGGSTF